MEKDLIPTPPSPSVLCFTGDGKIPTPTPIIVITRGPASIHPGERIQTCEDHDKYFAELIASMEG